MAHEQLAVRFGRALTAALGNPVVHEFPPGRGSAPFVRWGCLLHSEISARIYLVVWRPTNPTGERSARLEALVPFTGLQTVAVRSVDDDPGSTGYIYARCNGVPAPVPAAGIGALRGIGLEKQSVIGDGRAKTVLYRAVQPTWRGDAPAAHQWAGEQRRRAAAATAAAASIDWSPMLPFIQARLAARAAGGVVGGWEWGPGRGNGEPPEQTTVGDLLPSGGLTLLMLFPATGPSPGVVAGRPVQQRPYAHPQLVARHAPA